MSKGERKAFAFMGPDKRKEYMAGDAEKRKAMMADCEKDMAKAKTKEDAAMTGDSDESAQKIAKVEANFKKQLDDVVAKQDETIKALTGQVTKSEAELTTIKKRERLLIFTKRAEDELPHIAGKPAEKGETLMKIADALGEDSDAFKAYMDTQKAADKIIKTQFREVGKHGAGSNAGDPVGLLNAKATEIVKRDNVTQPVAFAKAMQENPELYDQYEAERRPRG
jgi:uncharacterized coiled-coil protein SlyX